MTQPTTGDGGKSEGTGKPDGTGATDPPKAPPGDGIDWKARAEEYAADVEKWKGLSRRHEERAKENADTALKAKTVEEQLAEMRKTMAERDASERARVAEHALDKVAAQLAESGIRRDDVAGLLDLVDTSSLLSEGRPDDAAITRLATSLMRVAGRATPDRDQGRTGGQGPADMTTLIRRAAGRIP